MDTDYDIIINGAGMVGLALAGLLADSTLRIAILDREVPPEPPEEETDTRVSALSLASCNLISSVKAWQAVEQRGLAPFRGMKVWDSTGSGSIEFDCSEIGQTRLGIIAENSVVRRALYDSVAGQNNVRMLIPETLSQFRVGAGRVEISTGNGKAYSAKLLVGADGADSVVREIAGLDAKSWPFMQKAIVCNVETEKSHSQIAWQRFLPTGPLAFLPLKETNRCSIVWSVDSDKEKGLLSLDDAGFIASLNEASEQALGEILKVGPRSGFDLTFSHANHYVQERVALVGDAAHRIHPLAGQGVNLGFVDAAVLAETVENIANGGRDIGRMVNLRSYERSRRGHNRLMMGLMDGFKRVFGSELPLVKQMRNFGLSLTDKIPPAKHFIMQMASGTSGPVPKAMRKSY